MTETYADLSFTTRPDPESELILWSPVSPTGSYARDCHAGSLYAFEALEFLLNNPTDMGYLLSGIALAMIRTVAEPSGVEIRDHHAVSLHSSHPLACETRQLAHNFGRNLLPI